MKYIISFIIRKIPRKYLQLFSHIILKIISPLYRGNNVECPVCGGTFSKFLPYGRMNPRPNALCPKCLALERHRLLWLYLKNKTSFFQKPLRVLHVAPEICFIKRFDALSNLEYITADLESPLAKVKMDIHQIPFPDNHFNVVMCNHVMEHLDDDIKALKEIYRTLVPGGWAIIQSPLEPSREKTYEDQSLVTPAQREKAHGQSDHVRTYGRDYGKRLSLAGFKVTEDNYVKELGDTLITRYALPSEEIIYLCRKE